MCYNISKARSMLIFLNSKKYPGLAAVVDDWVYEHLAQYTWHPYPSTNTFYAKRGIKNASGRHSTTPMHHDILKAAGIEIPPGMHVDHRDGNGLNNTLLNLRVCTKNENMRNRRSAKSGTSPFIGVYWDKSKRKYRGCIEIDGTSENLPRHINPAQVAKMYDFIAGFEFGPFDRPNFPGLRSPESQLEFFRQFNLAS